SREASLITGSYLYSKSLNFFSPTLHSCGRIINRNNRTPVLHQLRDCSGFRSWSCAQVQNTLPRPRTPRLDRRIGGQILHLERTRREESCESGRRAGDDV